MFDYHSRTWRNIRASVLRRDEYLCRECGRFGRSAGATTVHHILPADECTGKFERLKFDSANLISLCADCHNAMHERDTRALTSKGRDLLRRTKIEKLIRQNE